jgi:hypothetical protein
MTCAAGITPWYEQSACERGSKSKTFRYLPVGRNLRDHILLPRIFLTSHQCRTIQFVAGGTLIDYLKHTINVYMIAPGFRFNWQMALQSTEWYYRFPQWVLPYFGWEAPSACTSYLSFTSLAILWWTLSFRILRWSIRFVCTLYQSMYAWWIPSQLAELVLVLKRKMTEWQMMVPARAVMRL